MTEPKYVYRVPPCSKYDIAGMESWLEDLAAQGLFLDRDGLFWGVATLVQKEPAKLRFRLEATDTNGGLFSPTHDPKDEVIAFHQEMGWEYRGRWGQFHIYVSDDPRAPELHTDPRVQAMTIQALNKFQRTELFGIFWYVMLIWFFHGSVLLTLTVAWDLWNTLLLLAWLLSFPIVKFVGWLRMVKLKQSLKKGIPMPHRRDYQKKGKWVYAGRLCRWCAGLYLTFALLNLWSVSVTEENYVPMKDWNDPLPFATLQDFFPESEVAPDNSMIKHEVAHWENFIAPENYEYVEWSLVRDTGESDYFYFRVYYHELRWDWFARLYARELANNAAGSHADQLFERVEEPQAMSIDGVDYAVSYFRYNPGIVLCKDSTVIRVQYDRTLERYFTTEEIAQIVLDHLNR